MTAEGSQVLWTAGEFPQKEDIDFWTVRPVRQERWSCVWIWKNPFGVCGQFGPITKRPWEDLKKGKYFGVHVSSESALRLPQHVPYEHIWWPCVCVCVCVCARITHFLI